MRRVLDGLMKARGRSAIRRFLSFSLVDVGLITLGGATAILLVVAVTVHGNHASGQGDPAAAPRVAFIGDSYIEGTPIGGTGQANITVLLARRFGWAVTNAAVSGTGYTTGGGRSFDSLQSSRVISARPQLVIIFGSLNDMGSPQVDSSASQLYSHIRAALPSARLVVVGPAWIDGQPPPVVVTTRDEVRRAAGAAGLSFIDPIAEGWFAGQAESLIGSDHIHPTDQGHAHMAALLGDDLARLNVSTSLAH